MEQSYLKRNAAERERLHALVERLSDEDLAEPLRSEWTVAAALAHLAFWDRFVLVRWQKAAQEGQRVPPQIGDVLLDLTNAAAFEEWRALPPGTAAQQALAASEAVERLIAGLSDEVAAEAMASGRLALLDRTLHWHDHLDEIERVLGNLPGQTL